MSSYFSALLIFLVIAYISLSSSWIIWKFANKRPLSKNIAIRLMELTTSAILVSLALGTVTILLYHSIPKTEVRFVSSSGEYRSKENFNKGWRFEDIIHSYFRFKCSNQNIKMMILRTTEKPNWKEIEYWFDNFDEPKWKVPLRQEKNYTINEIEKYETLDCSHEFTVLAEKYIRNLDVVTQQEQLIIKSN